MSFGCLGRCDFCQFNKVKVSPLTCMQHFYCQTCRKYVARLQKNDFSCKLCDRKLRQTQADRQRESLILDDFMQGAAPRNTPNRGFQDVDITMTESNVFSLEDDKEKEDNDLSGNNDEWEYLISSLSYTPSFSGSKRTTRGQRENRDANTEDECAKRNRKKRSQAKYKPTTQEQDVSSKDSPSGDNLSDDSHMFNWYLTRARVPAPAHESDAREDSGVRSSLNIKLPPLKTLDSSSSSIDRISGIISQENKPNRPPAINPCWEDRSQSDSDEWANCLSKNELYFGADQNIKTQIEVVKRLGGTDQAYQKPSPTPLKGLHREEDGTKEAISQHEQIDRHNSQIIKDAKYFNLGWLDDRSLTKQLPMRSRADVPGLDYQDQVESPGFEEDDTWANSHHCQSPVDLNDSFWD